MYLLNLHFLQLGPSINSTKKPTMRIQSLVKTGNGSFILKLYANISVHNIKIYSVDGSFVQNHEGKLKHCEKFADCRVKIVRQRASLIRLKITEMSLYCFVFKQSRDHCHTCCTGPSRPYCLNFDWQ